MTDARTPQVRLYREPQAPRMKGSERAPPAVDRALVEYLDACFPEPRGEFFETESALRFALGQRAVVLKLTDLLWRQEHQD